MARLFMRYIRLGLTYPYRMWHTLAMSIRSRFWAKVDKRGPDECWPWTGCLTPLGYGQLLIHAKKWMAHRASWRIAHGPIPKGMCVCHHCDNPPCVNPAHLFLGTHKQNSEDMVNKGRAASGPFSPSKIRLIRKLYCTGHYTQAELAKRFGTTQPVISGITRGQTYRQAPGRVKQMRRNLDPEVVKEIRQRVAQGERQVNLAREFGVTKSAVSLIVRGLRRATTG